MNNDNKLVRGLYFNEPRQGAPDYVLCSISVHATNFLAWLNQQQEDEKGYIKIDVLRAKQTGKPYCKLNDYKTRQDARQPTSKREPVDVGQGSGSGEEVPF